MHGSRCEMLDVMTSTEMLRSHMGHMTCRQSRMETRAGRPNALAGEGVETPIRRERTVAREMVDRGGEAPAAVSEVAHGAMSKGADVAPSVVARKAPSPAAAPAGIAAIAPAVIV